MIQAPVALHIYYRSCRVEDSWPLVVLCEYAMIILVVGAWDAISRKENAADSLDSSHVLQSLLYGSTMLLVVPCDSPMGDELVGALHETWRESDTGMRIASM